MINGQLLIALVILLLIKLHYKKYTNFDEGLTQVLVMWSIFGWKNQRLNIQVQRFSQDFWHHTKSSHL